MSPKGPTGEEGSVAEEAFAAIVKALGDKPGVTVPDAPVASAPRFGSSALRIHGRIFAMVTRGRLVLKLPAPRVAELIQSNDAAHFDAGKGRPMKEWLSLEPRSQDRWIDLATEAMEFVGSRH
jgi:hypothetical protein